MSDFVEEKIKEIEDKEEIKVKNTTESTGPK